MLLRLVLLEWIDDLPVVLHVYDCPAFRVRLVEGLVEVTDGGRAIVGPLALCVGVVDEEREPRADARGRPLEHLQVAVGVAECCDGTAADVLVDAERFARIVVDEVDLRQEHDHRLAAAHFELRLHAAADDLLGRDAIDLFRPRDA